MAGSLEDHTFMVKMHGVHASDSSMPWLQWHCSVLVWMLIRLERCICMRGKEICAAGMTTNILEGHIAGGPHLYGWEKNLLCNTML